MHLFKIWDHDFVKVQALMNLIQTEKAKFKFLDIVMVGYCNQMRLEVF